MPAGSQLGHKFLRAQCGDVGTAPGFNGGRREGFGALNSLLIRFSGWLAGTPGAGAGGKCDAQRVRFQNMRIAALMRLRRHCTGRGHVLNEIFLWHHGEFRVRGGESIRAGRRLARARNVAVRDDVLDPAIRIQDCLKSFSRN